MEGFIRFREGWDGKERHPGRGTAQAKERQQQSLCSGRVNCPVWPMGPVPGERLWVGRNYSWKVNLGQGFWRASHDSLLGLHLVGHGNGTEVQRRDMMRSMFWKGHSGTDGGRGSSWEAAKLKSHCNCLSKKSGGHERTGRVSVSSHLKHLKLKT